MLKKMLIGLFIVLVSQLILFADDYDLSFDGTDDYLYTALDIQRSVYSELTISAWVNPASDTGWRKQVVSDDDGSYDRSLLRQGDSWAVFTGVGSWVPGPKVRVGEWQHIAVVYSSSDVKFYFNGTEYSYGNPDQTTNTAETANIGRNPTYGEYFDGSINEVRIWKVALTQSQIQDMMHNEITPSTIATGLNWSDLIGYWKFEEGSGQIAYDSSDSSNDARLGDTTSAESTDPLWEPSDTPLPVILSEFYAIFNDKTTLYWVTESENNNSGWNIYRADTDDVSYAEKINRVLIPSQNSNNGINEYEFIDQTKLLPGSTYYYWLENIDYSGVSHLYNEIEITIPTGDNNVPNTYENYGLHQNYPNPFNPSTVISFILEKNGNGSLEIYNIKGEKIKELKKGVFESDNLYKFEWDGKNENGKNVASGIYFSKLKLKNKVYTKKMILLK